MDGDRSDMVAFYEAPCHRAFALGNRRPAARNDCLGKWSLFIKSAVLKEQQQEGG